LSLPDLPTLALLSLAFAAVILLASGLDGMPRMTSAFRKISWLGDSTYGIYLCHMPFIWTASCVFNLTQLNRAKIVASPWFLLFYVVAVLGLGRLAFVYLELPAKRAIRNWYARRSAAKIGVAASAPSGLHRAHRKEKRAASLPRALRISVPAIPAHQ
jgi:peptidoglycan/LPS O-acetylase OafA/YrhL